MLDKAVMVSGDVISVFNPAKRELGGSLRVR